MFTERRGKEGRKHMSLTTRPAGFDDAVFAVLAHRHLPASWLAQQLGVDASLVSRVRSGERGFTRAQRIAIATILDLPLGLLFPSEAAEGAA